MAGVSGGTEAAREPVVDLETWRACEFNLEVEAPVVVGLEDNFAEGAAVAVAGRNGTDPRIVVEARLYENREKAFEAAAAMLARYQSSRLLVGKSMINDPKAVELWAQPFDGTDVAMATKLLRGSSAWAVSPTGPSPSTARARSPSSSSRQGWSARRPAGCRWCLVVALMLSGPERSRCGAWRRRRWPSR